MEHDAELDVHVLEDVMAFIDTHFGPSSGRAPLATVSPTGGTLPHLRAAMRDLSDKLLAAHGAFDVPSDALRAEFARTTVARTDAEEIEHRLRVGQQFWELQHRHNQRLKFVALQDKSLASVLRRRLDELVAHATSSASDRPLLDQKRAIDEVADCELRPLSRGLQVRLRSGRFIPFKLSVLARAAWTVVADTSFSPPGQSQAAMFEPLREIVGCLRDDEDASEIVTAMRRVEMPDGSILICWSTIHAAHHARTRASAIPLFRNRACDSEITVETQHAPALYRSSEAHETGWVRVGRQSLGAGSPPRSYIETVCDVVIQPTSRDLQEPLEIDDHQFERFRVFVEDMSRQSRTRNRQRLENQMIEISASVSRSGAIFPGN